MKCMQLYSELLHMKTNIFLLLIENRNTIKAILFPYSVYLFFHQKLFKPTMSEVWFLFSKDVTKVTDVE